MRRPVLVCRASNKGVLILREEGNTFYPRTRGGKAPARWLEEDELFIKHCLSGVRKMTPEELQQLPPEQVRKIDALNRKALTKIIHLKRDIAHSWTQCAVRPFGNIPISKTEKISDLIVDDRDKDLYLDIDIPRPLLIQELMKLKERQ